MNYWKLALFIASAASGALAAAFPAAAGYLIPASTGFAGLAMRSPGDTSKASAMAGLRDIQGTVVSTILPVVVTNVVQAVANGVRDPRVLTEIAGKAVVNEFGGGSMPVDYRSPTPPPAR